MKLDDTTSADNIDSNLPQNQLSDSQISKEDSSLGGSQDARKVDETPVLVQSGLEDIQLAD